jgi:hypothetical protein
VWDGTSWSLVPAPSPGGAAEASLSTISCGAPGDCVAFGEWTDTGNVTHLNFERFRHGAWAPMSGPTTADGSAPEISAISCPSRRTCTAVGGLGDGSAPRLHDRRWHLQTMPAVPDASIASLASVSSPTTQVCTAVGSDSGSFGGPNPLAERWVGVGHRRWGDHRRLRERRGLHERRKLLGHR